MYGWVTLAGSHEPVAGAEVVAMKNGRRATTDQTGFFSLASLRPGVDTLLVSHLGYTERRLAVEMLADRSVKVVFDISIEPIALGPLDVEVRGSFRTRQMVEFQRRREIRSGVFFTEVELAARGGVSVGFLLQGLPSVAVRREGAFGALEFTFRGRQCVPRVWIDGREVRPPGAALSILSEIRGSELETLELYRGNEGPLDLAGPCLTVVALTKR